MILNKELLTSKKKMADSFQHDWAPLSQHRSDTNSIKKNVEYSVHLRSYTYRVHATGRWHDSEHSRCIGGIWATNCMRKVIGKSNHLIIWLSLWADSRLVNPRIWANMEKRSLWKWGRLATFFWSSSGKTAVTRQPLKPFHPPLRNEWLPIMDENFSYSPIWISFHNFKALSRRRNSNQEVVPVRVASKNRKSLGIIDDDEYWI